MKLQDRLKRRTGTNPSAKTLSQLLPDANAADAKREIDSAKQSGRATLSFRDIGDTPPVTKRHAIAA